MKTKIFFLAVLIAGLIASCQNNVNTNAKVMPEPNYTTPPFIIDSHIHYRATDDWEKALVETYTKHHAMACLLIGMNDLERGLAFAKAHPELIIPYAAVDIESPTAVEDAQKAYDMGCKGLGELFARGNFDYCDPKYEPLWTLAEKLGMPIAPHTGNLANGLMHHLRPAALADICARHPKLMIHAAHFGNPWYEEAAECARRNVNLYFDLSGSSLIKKENDPWFWDQWLWWTDAIGKAHMPKNAVPAWEKIVFATDEGPDALIENIRRFNKVMDACKVDEPTRAKCYGLTIAKMHGIKVPESQVKSIDHLAIK